jgi:hypothetical protein
MAAGREVAARSCEQACPGLSPDMAGPQDPRVLTRAAPVPHFPS